jgi:hypothetical protein
MNRKFQRAVLNPFERLHVGSLGLSNRLIMALVKTGYGTPDGGGMVGLECAEFLVKKGHEVTIVEILEDVAGDMVPITRKLTLKEPASSKAIILTNTKITRLEGKKAYIKTDEKESIPGEFDSVVAAVGTKSVDELREPFEKQGIEVRTIGDAGKPGQIYDVIRDGFETAINI